MTLLRAASHPTSKLDSANCGYCRSCASGPTTPLTARVHHHDLSQTWVPALQASNSTFSLDTTTSKPPSRKSCKCSHHLVNNGLGGDLQLVWGDLIIDRWERIGYPAMGRQVCSEGIKVGLVRPR